METSWATMFKLLAIAKNSNVNNLLLRKSGTKHTM